MKNHFEQVPAKTYYGKHTTGSVLLRNGQVVEHGKTVDVSRLKKKLEREQIFAELGMSETDFNSVWVVVTTVNDGERDTFADIVLITRDKEKAEKLVAKLKKHKVKLEWLTDYDDAAFFSRTIDPTTLK